MFLDPAKIISQLDLTSGQIVADFGVGSGHYALAAAQIVGNQGTVYAFDIQTELLTRVSKLAAEKNIYNIKVMVADFEFTNSTKLKDETVDYVIISNIIFQLGNKENILREAFRITKKTGRLLIVDWSESFGGMGPQNKDIVTKDSAQKLVIDAGFSLVKTIEAGDHHYGLVFKK